MDTVHTELFLKMEELFRDMTTCCASLKRDGKGDKDMLGDIKSMFDKFNERLGRICGNRKSMDVTWSVGRMIMSAILETLTDYMKDN